MLGIRELATESEQISFSGRGVGVVESRVLQTVVDAKKLLLEAILHDHFL
jgi:hypothetical protein